MKTNDKTRLLRLVGALVAREALQVTVDGRIAAYTMTAVGALTRALRKRKLIPPGTWCRVTVLVMDPGDDKGIASLGVTVEEASTPLFGKGVGECLMAAAMLPPGDDEETVDALGRMLLAARSIVKYVESVAVVNRCAAQVQERADAEQAELRRVAKMHAWRRAMRRSK